MNCFFLVPSLKVGGGSREVIRLVDDLSHKGAGAAVVSMWDSPQRFHSAIPVHMLSEWKTSVTRAPFELPIILFRFARWLKRRNAWDGATRDRFVFTHYSTFPLALLVPREKRCFFVQGLEWRFVSGPMASTLLRHFVLFFYRRGCLISTNSYVSNVLRKFNLSVACETLIWADTAFENNEEVPRDIDFAMVLGKATPKRLDLYLKFIDIAQRKGGLSLAAISVDKDVLALVHERVRVCLLLPSINDMRELYSRSKCFLHMSETEGFGLPPLEAMGAGCVPLCRDSGGVRTFMNVEGLSTLLMPLSASVEDIFREGLSLVENPQRLKTLSSTAKGIFRLGVKSPGQRDAMLRQLLVCLFGEAAMLVVSG